MKKLALLFLAGTLAAATLTIPACVKKGNDVPEDQSGNDPNLPVTHKIAELLAMPRNIAITEDVVISGVVVMDDRSGNYYKKFVIQDSTGGIEINLDQNNIYNDYPVGRKVYVKCKGLTISTYGDNPQMGYGIDERSSIIAIPFVMADNFIVKANYPNEIKVDTLNFDDLYDPSQNTGRLNTLVAIRDVEFDVNSLGMPYAQSNSATSRVLQGCGAANTGEGLVVRTSNYAKFQPATIASGSGVIVGVYTRYNNTAQLVIRDTTDVQFSPVRCDGSSPTFRFILNEQFANFANWTGVNVIGDQVWTIASYGNPRPCALMNGYAGGVDNENEDWLISKPLDFTGFNTITMTFETAAKYGGNILECFVSTDYVSGEPQAATWTQITGATFADVNSANFVFVGSGDIDLSAYKNSNNVRIAFKYTSTTTDAPTWELDNVKIKGE